MPRWTPLSGRPTEPGDRIEYQQRPRGRWRRAVAVERLDGGLWSVLDDGKRRVAWSVRPERRRP